MPTSVCTLLKISLFYERNSALRKKSGVVYSKIQRKKSFVRLGVIQFVKFRGEQIYARIFCCKTKFDVVVVIISYSFSSQRLLVKCLVCPFLAVLYVQVIPRAIEDSGRSLLDATRTLPDPSLKIFCGSDPGPKILGIDGLYRLVY